MEFGLNGVSVEVEPTGSLLDVLRVQCAIISVKDGCSPQGQCGCCTVWVDGSPRLACVTPASRVQGREVTTLEGLASAETWAECMAACGASQCGVCTPGIVMRLAALETAELAEDTSVHRALKSHLCRCTGWTPILDAVHEFVQAGCGPKGAADSHSLSVRGQERARLEGGVAQMVGAQVALGLGGFAADTAPAEAWYGVAPDSGDLSDVEGWRVVPDVAAWRAASAAAPGRRSSLGLSWPIEPPQGPGEVLRTLQTTWVDPAYVELESSWCTPGGAPASPQANGGAFGAKTNSVLPSVVEALAQKHGVPVRAQLTREQVLRWGPKRPPMAITAARSAAGLHLRIAVARTPGIADALRAGIATQPLHGDLEYEITEVDLPGPPTSAGIRAAGWAEVAVLLSSLRTGTDLVVSPAGARAEAWFDEGGELCVRVWCGADLQDVAELTVLRSYCMGAVHMALGWVHSEGIAVDDQGAPQDLTLRSLGIASSLQMPVVHLEVVAGDTRAVNGSDAVFAAVAAAWWRRSGHGPRWPISG